MVDFFELSCQSTVDAINIYIYIYKSKDLMRESMRFCHVTLSLKSLLPCLFSSCLLAYPNSCEYIFV